jgi:hypothetical protein
MLIIWEITMNNLRVTVVTAFDKKRMRTIVNQCPDANIVTRTDHQICYVDTHYERFVSAERWVLSVEELCDFMLGIPNRRDYSFTSPASFAFSLWKKHFAPEKWKLYSDGFKFPFCRKSLFGGRCETLQFGDDIELNQFDITSSYPSASIECNFPDTMSLCFFGYNQLTQERFLHNIMYSEGASEVIFSQTGHLPVLPFRHDGRVIYPIADCLTGVYTHEELRYAIELGVTIHRVNKQYVADTTLQYNPFYAFVEYCFPLRAHHSIWKRIINSLFGRMGLTDSGGLLHFKAAPYGLDMLKVPSFLKHYFGMDCIAKQVWVPINSNPLWAAQVLSRARINLHKAATKPGIKVWYIDTDAIFTDANTIPTLKVGNGLGEWKQKIGRYTLHGAKQYIVKTPDGMTHIRLKGIPARWRDLDDFYSAAYTAERVITDTGETIPYYLSGSIPDERTRFRVTYLDRRNARNIINTVNNMEVTV